MRWEVAALLGAIGCAGCECMHDGPVLVRVNHDLDRGVERDVALGYELYESSLSRYGEWHASDERVVEWCPDGGFVPFRTDGRWVREGKHVRWQSSANDWRNLTTRSGRWVMIESTDSWCWVPGVARNTETPVVWRAGNGFIGWAPRPPQGEHIPDRAWTWSRVTHLQDEPLYVLDGDDEAAARAQSTPIGTPVIEDMVTYRESEPRVIEAPPTPAHEEEKVDDERRIIITIPKRTKSIWD